MIKNAFAILLLGLTATIGLWAQPATDTPATGDNSLLWEISGQDLEQSSYLFGTIHMINKADFFLTPAMKESFGKAESVVFEINLEEMSDFATLMPLMMKAFMADGLTLRDLLEEEEYALVSGHFEKLGLPMVFLDRIKPMFLSAMSSEDALSFNSDTAEIVSYEMELMGMAKTQEKPMAGLETAAFQMSMFDSIPYEVQARMLVESIEAGDAGNDQFRQMVELYKAQDLQGLQDMLNSDPEGLGEYTELLLERRNRNWIPVMSEMMTEGPVFFAVGAGHLGGEAGVITLLREVGYTVRPLR